MSTEQTELADLQTAAGGLQGIEVEACGACFGSLEARFGGVAFKGLTLKIDRL